MADAPRPALCLLILAFCVLTMTLQAAAETAEVEAVVEKFEFATMEDFYDDGRFAVYDAVTFRVLKPAPLANKRIRLHVASGSVAKESPLRSPGRRCRFEFETDLLKLDQLFLGAIEKLQWLTSDGAVETATDDKTPASIDTKLLAAIERELTRLAAQAESEPGPDVPRPSSQVAYYLIAGLAAEGAEVDDPTEAERRRFQLELRGGTQAKLLSVFSDLRVVIIDQTIADKAGSYAIRVAVLYLKKDEQWKPSGKGHIVVSENLSSRR